MNGQETSFSAQVVSSSPQPSHLCSRCMYLFQTLINLPKLIGMRSGMIRKKLSSPIEEPKAVKFDQIYREKAKQGLIKTSCTTRNTKLFFEEKKRINGRKQLEARHHSSGGDEVLRNRRHMSIPKHRANLWCEFVSCFDYKTYSGTFRRTVKNLDNKSEKTKRCDVINAKPSTCKMTFTSHKMKSELFLCPESSAKSKDHPVIRQGTN